MQKRSDRSSRRPAVSPAVAKGRPAMLLEGLEDRRLMSVVGNGAVPNSAVRLETSLGRITLLLSTGVTPLTVQNFLHYVNGDSKNQDLYNNTIIHRSVPGFVIQMGGYKAGTSGYTHIPTQAAVPSEFTAVKAAAGGGDVNTRGTVSVALSGSTNDTGTSEFFINLANNSHSINPNTGQDLGLDVQNGGFTTFARVIGGGMHVADAIANLKTVDASNLNTAFSDLPVVTTSTGPNPVFISSAKAQTTLTVKLGDGDPTKFVTWVDEKGGTATVSLSKGTADLTFVGGNDMRTEEKGNRIIVTGKGVDLEELVTHNTTKASVLAIKSVGGNGAAHIGNITVNNGSLASVAASTIQLQGDITAANGSIGSIDLQGTFRSTILTNGGSLSVKIGTAFDTSVNTSGDVTASSLTSTVKPKGTIKSLIAQKWQDDGELPTSIVTGNLNSMAVNGNFTSTIRTSGDVGRIKVNGNVGTLGTSSWAIGGNLKTVQVGKVMGLKASAAKDITSFTAREVLNSGDGATTTIAARSIGKMTLATLTNQSAITATGGGIGSINIAGLMDSSTIRATKNIGTVSALSMAGTNPDSTGATLVASGIYAGVVTTLTGPVTLPASFKNSSSTIGSVRVQKTFSNTNIAAPILQDLNLATVQAASIQHFGVTAHVRIGHLGATIKGKSVNLRGATTNEAVQNYFTGIGLPLTNSANGNRFTVAIV